MGAGCNFACASTLCGLIAGASTIFYRQSGSDRARFTGVLNDYYPWALQPTGGASQTESVAAIYADYRNPLAHAWGACTKEVGKDPDKRGRHPHGSRPLSFAMPPEALIFSPTLSTGERAGWSRV